MTDNPAVPPCAGDEIEQLIDVFAETFHRDPATIGENLERLSKDILETARDAILSRFAAQQAEIETLRTNFSGLRCRFGCDEVVGLFHVPEGCVCWTDPVQALCSQHALRAQSNGPITLIAGEWPGNARSALNPTVGGENG